MKPYKSNTNKEDCSPVSSNCVIWQGPDLPCLNLCKGDTVSDVVYKLAEEVCQLKDNIGLSNVDIECLLTICSTTPEPSKTLANILQLLINKVCCINDIIDGLPGPGTNYVEPTLNLTACLQYSNGTGGNVTQLVLSQYVLRIATVLCSINTTVNTHTSQISILQGKVTALENAVPVVPQISSCLLGTIADVETVVQELETQFCAYKVVLGSTASINTAIGLKCTGLTGATPALATGNPMGVDFPWKNTIQNLADSLSNLWFTVCDIRSAVKIIQSSCCKIDCNSIVVNFDYKWIDEFTLRLYFSPKTTVPLGFWDCNDVDGNEFTFTDGLGNSYPVFIHFRRQNPTDLTGVLDDPTIIANGYDVDLSLSPLDTTTGLVISSPNLCFTNGDISCVKCFDKNIAAYINKDCCTITSSTVNTVIYKVCLAQITTTTTPPPPLP
jgi:hypothetical protein